MKHLKKIAKFLGRSAVVLILALLLFECLFRCNVIDFYKSELNGLNTEESLKASKKKTLLIFGDSFSADLNGYVGHLRDSMESWNIVNSAVPGTSTKQMQQFFEDRLEEFSPDKVLIQLYVGNDFQDYSHTRNWSELSFSRNLYWLISDRLTCLQYFNYKMGGWFKSAPKMTDPKIEMSFDAASYNHREKVYFSADANSLYHSIQVKGDKASIFEEMMEDLSDMVEEIDVPITVLVLPHAGQVTEQYRLNLIKIGAKLPKDVTTGDFPFFDKLKKRLEKQSNVKVITPLFDFRSNNRGAILYFPNDPHLNAEGQLELYRFLRKNIAD